MSYSHCQNPLLMSSKQSAAKDVLRSAVESARQLPGAGASLAATPGKSLELLTNVEEAGETPLRNLEYDLKQQHFGPSFLNPQRLYEIGDTALYLGAYGLPAAAAGTYLAGPAGLVAGLGLGKAVGQIHATVKERERLEKALKRFDKTEKKLLKKLKQGYTYGFIPGALAGAGLGGYLGYTSVDKYKIPLALFGAISSAGTLGLLGSLLGHKIQRERLKDDPEFRDILRKYE
jgi:hypothetical protein